MTFWRKFAREALGILGLTGDEPPRLIADVFLGALAGASAIVLVAYAAERHPAVRLQHATIASLIVLVASVLLADNRLIVILGAVAIVGFRGFIAFALYGYGPGLAFAIVAAVAVWMGNRYLSGN